MRTNKNIIARTGNFIITIDGGSDYKYLRIKSVSGHWGVTYRDDNEMYGKIMAMINDKEHTESLEMYVLHLFYATTMPIDKQFALDFLIAVEALRDRMVKAQGEPTEEEEGEAIAEAEVMEDIKEILNSAE